SAVALEDSSICFVENQTIKDLFTADAEFTFEVMKFYSKEFLKIEQRIKSFKQMTMEERITHSLLDIIDVFGLSENENEINITLSRKEIADIVGTNADQVSRTISYLKQKKIISTLGKRIFLTDYIGLKNSLSRYSEVLS
ncbi:MAG: Crp/Fnr family transcriptional regulator, partial [Bacteroidetes bacterium HGW-Bacteroidetes-12]